MIEHEFLASVDELTNVLAFIEEELDKLSCSMKASTQIQIAAEEIFVNIAHYAYPNSQGKMKLTIVDNPDNSVSLQFVDHGIPFNPLEKQDPDINLDAEDRNIGGLGIFMVKKSMDLVEYKYESEQNILTITKKY